MGTLSDAAIALLLGIVVTWGVLLVALFFVRPKGALLSESIRLLPDVLRLIGRLARDRSLPRGVRVRLWLLIAYLALPIDLVPDFIPVVGYADDAIIVVLVLRSTVRAAGLDAVQRHWTGTSDGFSALQRIVRL
jgi:uncharacterized membrane protein YkvA (DUF1232 family)